MIEFIIATLIILPLVNIILFLVMLKRIPQKETFTTELTANITKSMREEFKLARDESNLIARLLREEITGSQNAATRTMVSTLSEIGKTQNESLSGVLSSIEQLSTANEARLNKLRETLDQKLVQLQNSNEAKLNEMRETVDEKLHNTLEKRLGESFKLVSQQLEAVQLGLGEMRSLATGVGDLKKVLSNVKTRGTFGEVQLAAILEEILTQEQYEKNVKTKQDSRENVEFAIRLPGSGDDKSDCVYLPIDSKFPQEDYQRLVDAADAGNIEELKIARASLVRAIKISAKEIESKYLNPPKTTDFAILFLPTEGLYAEVLQYPGLVDELLRVSHIVVSGPTTLAAILSSLRMGFRTLAIEKRSGEVWKILGAVKTEFGKYSAVLDKLKTQLSAASNTVDETNRRTRVMQQKLRDVEKMPERDSLNMLDLNDTEPLPLN